MGTCSENRVRRFSAVRIHSLHSIRFLRGSRKHIIITTMLIETNTALRMCCMADGMLRYANEKSLLIR